MKHALMLESLREFEIPASVSRFARGSRIEAFKSSPSEIAIPVIVADRHLTCVMFRLETEVPSFCFADCSSLTHFRSIDEAR